MDAYFPEDLEDETVIDMTDSGYTNDEVALRWLQHFIKHTSASAESEYKMLLFDGHGSHTTSEFCKLATANNIILCQYPPHLTHLLQPLDVGVFQSYKHYHQKAVYKAIRTLQYEYNYACFLRDITSFRRKTFTESTICSAFQKSGMWPPSPEAVLRRMKKYQDPEPELPSNSPKVRPETIEDIEAGLKAWKEKAEPLMSSPSRRRFQEFTEGTQVLVTTLSLEQNDLIQMRLAAKEKLKRQAIRRKYTVGKGAITAKAGRKAIAEKLDRQSKKGISKGRGKGKGKGKGKGTVTIPVSSDSDLDADSDDDDDDDQWDHPEMEGVVFGDMAGVPDPFNPSYDYIRLK